MYKVMLVDDEPIIVEGLSHSVDWAKFGCEVVCTANDGIEGIEKMKECKPDLLFLDICMPEMDGLTMIAAIKSQFFDVEISILTGFRDFDFAREALHLGVTRFLLKPSNMADLEEAIRIMCNNLDGIKNNETSEENKEENKEEKVTQQQDAKQNKEGTHENSSSRFIVKNALSYIEKNYTTHLSLGEVADHTYVSQWHLSKILNKYTGKNFSELLNQVRIEQAKKLLEDPSLRIGEIAEMVGFLDLAHFSRVFKKQEGISANEFRNQL
ncbi:MAG: response regulator [Lachnospiraceae bacterium]